MRFISLHTKNTAVVYKSSIFSSATCLVSVFFILSLLIPFFIVSLLSPYSGIAESRILFEQPLLRYKFQSFLLTQTQVRAKKSTSYGRDLTICSTFPHLYQHEWERICGGTKFWKTDINNDGKIDKIYMQMNLDFNPKERKLIYFEFALFFKGTLKHKCKLSPPALLTYQLHVPDFGLDANIIHLKCELKLKQLMEFTCPFPGRTMRTMFHGVEFNTSSSDLFGLPQLELEHLSNHVKSNPGYFVLDVQEKYYRKDNTNNGLKILLDIDVLQIPARYHLNVWERLGQFWLYFASFFGVSFYIMNKIKDYLFEKHIIRSWEIIPWKKLY